MEKVYDTAYKYLQMSITIHNTHFCTLHVIDGTTKHFLKDKMSSKRIIQDSKQTNLSSKIIQQS